MIHVCNKKKFKISIQYQYGAIRAWANAFRIIVLALTQINSCNFINDWQSISKATHNGSMVFEDFCKCLEICNMYLDKKNLT